MTDQTNALTTAIADLVAKVTDLSQAIVDHDVEVQKQIEKMNAVINKSAAKDDPDVARALDAISSASATLARTTETVKKETADLAASVIPAAATTA